MIEMCAEQTTPGVSPEEAAKRCFEKDTATHELHVVRDDGLYRHLRFNAPGTYMYGFDLVTWPGYLAYVGDMGEYMFTRLDDMFRFFESGDGINPVYWAEKYRPGGERAVRRFSQDVYEVLVREWLERIVEVRLDLDNEETDETRLLRAAVSERLLVHPLDERAAHNLLHEFEHNGIYVAESWEWDLTEFDNQFLWCCWAIKWGIAEYRKKAVSLSEGEQRYSLREIDQMRSLVHRMMTGGCHEPYPERREQIERRIEDRLRTYMANGTSLVEMERISQ